MTITLRIHPRYEQEVAVLRTHGPDALWVETPDGKHTIVPAAWTDWRPRAGLPEIGGRQVLLVPEAMKELVDTHPRGGGRHLLRRFRHGPGDPRPRPRPRRFRPIPPPAFHEPSPENSLRRAPHVTRLSSLSFREVGSPLLSSFSKITPAARWPPPRPHPPGSPLALQRVEMLDPPEPRLMTRILSNLATVLKDLGLPANARPLIERTLTIAEKTYGLDHPYVATILSNLAVVLKDLGLPADARPLLERALTIDEKTYGPDHPEVATLLCSPTGARIDGPTDLFARTGIETTPGSA